ncbi:YbaB/EbfC family nucleoid-associated protein [Microbacterium sp. SORGH_AS_0888]|uniref:YbaB/EbfC family nucleoid-associated protein n=1 Tax=Microbacterium sp. SORGH_AS_0888 TaxID=3041791 RepID=UPI00278ACC28|nr:YbaB/EbfC family nucleoid-associated protein [Microbacterium sp. SORGH_AS_0888]MDQ1128691.1 hypothetical protein [Microbacterium sp. SORGH_AS_0888]
MSTDIDTRLEAARARLDAQLAAAREARADLDSGLEQLRTITATVRSERGECAVTAGVEGAVTAIQLDSDAEAGPALAATLTRTIARAQAAAREAAATRAATLLGESSPIVAQLRQHGGR